MKRITHPVLTLITSAGISQAALVLHSSMDNIDVGAGLGTDNTNSGNFNVGNAVGTDGTATAVNTGGSVTSGTTGQFGEAITFSTGTGGDRNVNYGNNFDVGNSSQTVSLWINSNSSGTGARFIASKGNVGSGDNGWSIWLEGSSLIMRGEYTGSDNSTQNLAVSHAFDFDDNVWHHVALVIDNTNGTWTGYLDGDSSADHASNGWSIGGGGGESNTFAPGSDFSNTSSLRLGASNSLTAEWAGSADDFGIWNEALSASQIDEIALNGVASVPEPSSVALLGLGGLALLLRRRK
ncbi:LamG domain-containing protein [Verrucomicrobiaceae bacterium N1E253]|uniref:LamG domain-containing protein n=1 Tax=Oceaniferula marina TaxID=2748318 RepID=A0A851GBG9_9BACT|nr:LamG domain-containing protein [Oceaniferula marina]NWK54766.1 LamG domain-containing protein [Oceaniferula marina]